MSDAMTEEAGQTTTMQQTALHAEHERLGAKLVDFNGYWMPIYYTGIIEEHQAVRSSLGLLDLSHMGEVEFVGPDASGVVQQLVTNDVAKLHDGQAVYSPMCREDGGILDDLIIYRRAADHFFIVINCSNIEKDTAWMRSHTAGRVIFRDISRETSLIALQGPKAAEVIEQLFDRATAQIKRYGFVDQVFEGERWTIARTSYTGEDGFELFGPNATAPALWRTCLEVGQRVGIRPVGLGARDTLRLEAALVLYGHEIDETRTPWEANLGWSVALGSKKGFIGSDALAARRAHITEKLIGFVMEERAIPRSGCQLRCNGQPAGIVTSGSFCPTIDQAIGLGYLPRVAGASGTSIDVMIRERPYKATVVTIPFLKRRQVIDAQRRSAK